MSPYEPFWDPRVESWPGTLDVNGRPHKGDMVYESHLGVWCHWVALSGLGVVACTEIRFDEDHRFEWLSLRSDDGRNHSLEKQDGTWQLRDDVLELAIEHSDDPAGIPRFRRDARITDREGRLVLETIRLDDEEYDAGCEFLYPARAGDAAMVLEAAIAKTRAPVGSLPKPYSTLETLLKMSIPMAVKKLALPEPAFCMRLYYYDTHAPGANYGFEVRILTESVRRSLVSASKSPGNVEHELWHPQSGVANGTPGKDLGLYDADLRSNKEISRLFAEVYELLSESEEDHMSLVRELARKVAKALTTRAWGTQLPTTDDFVVIPADGSGFFGGVFRDDLEASVSAEKIELLKQRGYLS